MTVPNAVSIKKRICVLLGKTSLPRFEVYYWYPGPWRGHIREYTKDDLIKLCEYLDLRIIEIRSCDHEVHKLPTVVRPVYSSLTKLFPGWKDSWLLVAKKKPDWTPKKNLPPNEFARILKASAMYQY